MKSLAAFVAVNAFFVALNILFAGLIYGLFRLGQTVAPELMEIPLFTYLLGLACLAATIWFAWKSMQIMGRLAQGRGRGRG